VFMRKSCVSLDQDKYNPSVSRPFLWVGITMVVLSFLMLSVSVSLLYFYTEMRSVHDLLLIQFSSRLCVCVCIVQFVFPCTCVPFHYHINRSFLRYFPYQSSRLTPLADSHHALNFSISSSFILAQSTITLPSSHSIVGNKSLNPAPFLARSVMYVCTTS